MPPQPPRPTSLADTVKQLAREWRELFERGAAITDPDADDSPAAALLDAHWDHPIWSLFRAIEEATGIPREILEQVAWRINSALGLSPLKRQGPGNRPELPDLRWVYAKLNDCDLNGIGARILDRFFERYPSALAPLEVASSTSALAPSPPSGAAPHSPSPPVNPPPSEVPETAHQYVTLDQMAALVNRSKKTLERALNKRGSTMPRPDVEGAGGKPHEWLWPHILPWLKDTYPRRFPERFPTGSRH